MVVVFFCLCSNIIDNMSEVKALSKKKKILRSLLVVFVTLAILGLVFELLYFTGWWEKLNSVTKLKNVILGLGFWGRLVFVILQFLQVTFIPIPSPILIIAGSIIFGPFQASLLSFGGILLGSAVAFFIGRVFGRKVVEFMVGEESAMKWTKTLSHGKYSFAVMMLLPFFPDDILCLVAGLTNMSWGYFMAVQFIARPIGIFTTAYFSSGELIPYHSWGLVVWAVIAVLAVAIIYLTTKYNDQIEKYINKLLKKQKN